MIFQAPSGSPVTWTTVFSCKGAYWGLNSAESVAALAAGGIITGKVRIRFRPIQIKGTWRILIGSTVLNIVGPAINVGGRGEYLEMKVKEVTG
jgi:head-tail adaptor